VLRGALLGGLSSLIVSLSFTLGSGKTPTVRGVLFAFGTGALFGAIAAVAGPGIGIATASIPTLLTGVVRTVMSLIEIHRTRDVYYSDIELQTLVYFPSAVVSGGGISAVAQKEGALLVLVVATFSFIAGIVTTQFSELVKEPLLPQPEDIFWYQENKYPQPIKNLL
jgi:hypothetical protein